MFKKPYVWSVLLVLMSAGLTFGFACALPLAAFATIAALTLPWFLACVTLFFVVAFNQILGFSLLGYPLDFPTLSWGGVFLFVCLMCFLVSHFFYWNTSVSRSKKFFLSKNIVRAFFSFLLSFAVYEGIFFTISLGVGGTENYFFPIQARIFNIQLAAFFLFSGIYFLLSRLPQFKRVFFSSLRQNT